jgi:2-oxoglutarate ferredoxin oxidoreductase subunit gamma
MDIRLSGFGGQGIIKSGLLIGKAASIFDSKYATTTQSFGPEARGGACSVQLVILDTPVQYPYIHQTDILVSMSQEAYYKYAIDLKKGGLLLTDSDLVKLGSIENDVKAYSIPSTRFAEELGNRIFANIIMVGFFTAITKVLNRESVLNALPGSVPARFIVKNQEALQKGYEFGVDLLAG